MCSISIGSSLQEGKYRIKSKIMQDGLCISYSAIQSSLNRIVVIKEFYMRDFCSREKDNNNMIVGNDYVEQINGFKAKFLSDAKSYASGVSGSDIKIIDIFEENNTAYYVYLDNRHMENDEPDVDESKDVGENTRFVENDTKGEVDEVTIVEVKKDGDKGVDISPQAKENEEPLQQSFWRNRKRTLLVCLGLVILGFLCTSVALRFKFGSNAEPNMLTELEDTLLVEDEVMMDTLVYDNDMQGPDQMKPSERELEEYINMSKEWLEKSKRNLHKPSNVQNILNARYYYYDKADKVNYSLRNERLPANKEIDEITEQEFQYWVNEAKKLGSDKNKFELKRTCLQRAKSLAFRHKNLLDSQIKWLDEQLAKKKGRKKR